MADRKPLKVLPDSASGTGGGDSTGIGEFVAADTLGVVDGGTGLATVATSNILTGNGTSALSAESNLTFDGSTLAVSADQYIANGKGLVVGNATAVGGSHGYEIQALGTGGLDAGVTMGNWAASAAGPVMSFIKSRNATIGSNTIVQDDDVLGSIFFTADDGTDFESRAAEIRANIDGTPGANDTPGRLTFHTAADGANTSTERMRINSAGHVGIGVSDISFPLEVNINHNSNYVGNFNQQGTATNSHVLKLQYGAASPDNTSGGFLFCMDSTTTRMYVLSDGDIANHDGTYGTLSDAKLKQDITDVRSYWSDFKSLQYRRFRHKTDVEANADAPYRLGLIAQEVETIFPALVPESPDADIETQGDPILDELGEPVLDDDGNPTYKTVLTPSGTTHKWVKSSIVEGPIMGSVVQELQTRLEAAEAKITALESA